MTGPNAAVGMVNVLDAFTMEPKCSPAVCKLGLEGIVSKRLTSPHWSRANVVRILMQASSLYLLPLALADQVVAAALPVPKYSSKTPRIVIEHCPSQNIRNSTRWPITAENRILHESPRSASVL